MPLKKVTIIGVGLIGASLALALREHDICSEITGTGRTEETLVRARELGIIDSYTLNRAEACRDADIVVFASPVGCFKDILSDIKDHLKGGAIVTDVGSVKGDLVLELEAEMPDGVFFVGTHPIAGSDRSGIDSATAALFKDALCIVTPTENTHIQSLEKIETIWTTIGAGVKRMSVGEHDRIFSSVSHLPHVTAYAVVKTVADINASYIHFSGQGFKDTTRIAKSSPEIWIDICKYNKGNILEHLDILIRNLDSIKKLLKDNDYEALEKYFLAARTLRKSIG